MNTPIPPDDVSELIRKVREEIERSADILRPGELAISVEAVIALHLQQEALSRRSADSRGVGVRALEWAVDDDRLNLVAHTVVGRYAITMYQGMEEPARLYAPTWPERKSYRTEDEAKAAAQTHFDTTIRSALQEPAAGEPVALIDQAMACDAWPSWLSDIVDLTNQASDAADMSTEQAVAYGILQALRRPSIAPATPVGEVTDEMVERAARVLVPVWYGGFEDQTQNNAGGWLWPHGTPNERARATARAALTAALSAGKP